MSIAPRSHDLLSGHAPADAGAICEAVAAGRVQVESRPLAWAAVVHILGAMTFGGIGAASLNEKGAHLEVESPALHRL